MANMFSSKDNKPIPTSLSECTQLNETTRNLYDWAQRLEKWGEWLLYALVVIGIISTLTATLEAADINDDLVFPTLLTTAVTWVLYAFIEYCAYQALALLLNALATITHNTSISANVALYEASQIHTDPAPRQTTAPQTTAQPATAQPATARPAPIFSDKSTDHYSQITNRTSAPDTMWVCKNCGTHNSLNYGQCKKCGKYKS